MKLLFIGDIVGSPGREMVTEYLPKLKEKYRPQVTIVNGENAAGGKGITEKIYKQFLQLGIKRLQWEIIRGTKKKLWNLSTMLRI